MDRHAAPQVGQRKRVHTVAAIGGADQIEQRFVLANRLQLAVTKRPVYRREVEAEAADFPDIRVEPWRPLKSPQWMRDDPRTIQALPYACNLQRMVASVSEYTCK